MTTKPEKPFACQECGKRYTLRAAERIVRSGRCSCGGCDIDLYVAR